MKKETIQYIFIIFVAVLLVLGLIGIGFYFWQAHVSWQTLKNDPAKSKFANKIDTLEKKSSKTSDDYLQIGNDYYSLGLNSEAIDAYQKAVDAGSYDVGGLNLANAYIADKEYKNAETEFKKLIDKNLGSVDLYLKFADLYKNDWQGKSNDTLGILKEAEGKYPNDYNLLVNLAEYYLSAGNKNQALEYYNKALKLDPNNEVLKKEMEMVK